MKRNFLILSLVLLSLLTPACLSSKDGKQTLTTTNPEQGPVSTLDANFYPINKVVCDPFDPNPPGPNDGLVASLYYRKQDQAAFGAVLDYIEQAQESNKNLFFSSLNVPTRIFSLGFPSETGEMVKNDAGSDLVEYFALRFHSILKLSAPDEEGEYELALLSDDGATFKIKQADGSYKMHVNNDGDHPTRFGCGTEKIVMNRNTELAVQLDYYQGPRYHISLIPMWRKVNPNNAPETSCGLTSNEAFFDYNNASAPQSAYNQILARGWKPIAAANWHLPSSAIFNPCVSGTVPVISDFKLVRSEEGFVTFSWKTDIPSTSQLLFKNVATGVEGLTVADNTLRTSHQVNAFHGIVIGQTYDFQGISISADYGKSMSSAVRLKVQ